jgi:hypothetical protein
LRYNQKYGAQLLTSGLRPLAGGSIEHTLDMAFYAVSKATQTAIDCYRITKVVGPSAGSTTKYSVCAG